MDTNYYWANDPYWTEALDKYGELKDKGKKLFVIDLKTIDDAAFNDDSPAYKLMDAMVSVNEKEGYEGFRGAPRVLFALLVRLEELSKPKSRKSARKNKAG
jgi:hypothetical protein